MMTIIYLLCLFGLTLSSPINNNDVTILKYENDNDGLGSYRFEFETSDGTKRREEGVLKNPEDPENSFVAVSGFYSYIGPDGVTYTVTYIADENGFQPVGAHLPTAEPQPETRPVPIVGQLPPAVIASLLG